MGLGAAKAWTTSLGLTQIMSLRSEAFNQVAEACSMMCIVQLHRLGQQGPPRLLPL